MQNHSKTFQVTKVKVADLRPHPRQCHLFSRPATEEVVALADDMQSRGLQHPIEVLPNLTTVLCGHSRVLAAHYLSWKEIDAFVRDDLGALNDVEIEKHMIGDNALRRHLRPLERAKCAFRLRELYHGGNRSQLDDDSWEDVHIHTRDWIGAIMHISGRTATRLLAVAETPEAVQLAYDERRLSLTMAVKIANLSRSEQDEIAADIQSGTDPKEAARKFISCPRRATVEERVLKRLVAALGDALESFKDGFSEVQVVGTDEDDPAPTLRRGMTLLESLALHVEHRQEKQTEALADKMDSIGRLLPTGTE
ncbi:ParB/RepB/Spo0J family partition protein [Planctomycetota bacterium]